MPPDMKTNRIGQILMVARVLIAGQLAMFMAAAIWVIITPKWNAPPPPNANWSLTNIGLIWATISVGMAPGVRRLCEALTSWRIKNTRRRNQSDQAVRRRGRAFQALFEGYLFRVCFISSVLLGPAYFLLVTFAYEKQMRALLGAIALAACAMVDWTSATRLKRWLREKFRLAQLSCG